MDVDQKVSMTWGEFKEEVNNTIPDDAEIWWIDVTFPTEINSQMSELGGREYLVIS